MNEEPKILDFKETADLMGGEVKSHHNGIFGCLTMMQFLGLNTEDLEDLEENKQCE